ncbi:MAG: hypothetical protein JWO38_4877 [Gemmataceae bacterium]|nr:hypothetical protein [Gemmataceae bacterium]
MAFDLARVRQTFFDSAAVMKKVPPAERKILSKAGAFVRQRAKTSIRKRKAPSAPGQPPSSHTNVLKKYIFFGYDPTARSVVVGPTVAGSATGAPRSLEEGGTATLRERLRGGTATRTVRIRPRPFMGPAFAVELDKVKGDLRNLIK